MTPKILKIFFIIIFFIIASAAKVTLAEEDSSAEYLVKSAFIYNFAKFVEWPDEAFSSTSAPIILCILGNDPFGATIETISGKVIRGRKLKVKVISKIEDIDKCHILFVCRSEKDHLKQFLDIMKNTESLTIADMNGFADQGGIINFIKSGNKIKFEINLDAANDAGLRISSKLLKLAKIVRNK